MNSGVGDESFEAATREGDLPESETSLVLSKERLLVSNRRVPSGKAVLRKVIVVEQRTITVEVAHEEIRLDYLPLTDENRDVATALHLALPEMVLHEEQLVITKRIVPIERVRPTIVTVPGEFELTEDLRHEEIELSDTTHTPPSGRGGPTT